LAELANAPGGDPWLSPDGNTLVYSAKAPNNRSRLMVAERAGNAPFAVPMELPLTGWKGNEYRPSLSSDQKTLYFTRGGTIVTATRADTAAPFEGEQVLALEPPDGATAVDVPRPAGGALYFTAYERSRRWGVYRRDRVANTTSAVFPSAGRIGGMAITSDEKILYLAFDEGGQGWAVYRAERSSREVPFPAPTRVDELDMPNSSTQGFGITGVSDDDCEVVGFVLSLDGEMSVYRATRGR
jgi:dipeptidyl aminopeptidase/acylaminoacyl peptidase